LALSLAVWLEFINRGAITDLSAIEKYIYQRQEFMAKFIGTNIQDGNWGEDYFVQKLMEYLDDSFVIYRNRPVFGAQFDVCLFAPNVGIIIFEVKAWKPSTIKRVQNGDTIVIRAKDNDTGEEREKEENPTKQVRGYVYKMRSKVRQKTEKTPLIYGMTCFPNLTKDDYDSKGLEPVCEYEETILKEDIESKAALFAKLNLSVKNHRKAMQYMSDFTSDLMFRTRQIFESDLKLEDQTVENTDLVEAVEYPGKAAYSIFAYIPHDDQAKNRIKGLTEAYSQGTKLYVVVTDVSELKCIEQEIAGVLKQKGLAPEGSGLVIDFSRDKPQAKASTASFSVFGCSAFLLSRPVFGAIYFTIENGQKKKTELPEIKKVLIEIDRQTNFNLEQYLIEHSDLKKNIIVRAGAGTGKTHTMISRIAFICCMSNCSLKEMASRIVMITFTDDAANQMEEKIKEYFNNYYLLTGDTDCLSFINQIEGMQISTIHSYAKKLISLLGMEYGYGNDISITSGDYKLKQIITEQVDDYIRERQRQRGSGYVTNLGLPIYQINRSILNMLNKLHNQSVDVSSLDSKNFGTCISESESKELHQLFVELVPKIEQEANSYFKKKNRVHLSNMMSMLELCIKNEMNQKRLFAMQTGRPQYMFVDEFQDTDDVQIDVLTRIAELLQYRLFVVGDVKQCIYRFRGAKENAFEQLNYKNNPMWDIFSLSKNYRTDARLLDLFHESFRGMGERIVDKEQLLIYGATGDQESGRLTGTKSFNTGLMDKVIYHKVAIDKEEDRMSALFEEIDRQKKLILETEKNEGRRLSKRAREIAILVRENWQAETIRETGKQKNVDVITNTGGDLYFSEPARDMMTLINALIHYDEADYLYAFVNSNFIGGGMSKAFMYSIRDDEKKNAWKKTKSTDTGQADKLQKVIDMNLASAVVEDWKESRGVDWKTWRGTVKALRTVPVLQVLRKIYGIFQPWMNYGKENRKKREYYRLNVELLFEELINTVNKDSVSINSLADTLFANMISQKNVDSRELETSQSEDITVRCVTIHKAKGLEYGTVILPHCSYSISRPKRTDMNVSVQNDELLKVGYQIKYDVDHVPMIFQNDFYDEQLEKNERMREEARILYVAMTRAIRTFSWIALNGTKNECWQKLIWEG